MAGNGKLPLLFAFAVCTGGLLFPPACRAAQDVDFCAGETDFCDALSRPDYFRLYKDDHKEVTRLATAYLTCLNLGGRPLGELPHSKLWNSVTKESLKNKELYYFIDASIRGDQPQALKHCQAVFPEGMSEAQCSAFFNAYRSYYSPVCSDLKSPFLELDPVYLEFACRTKIYPDARTCALLTVKSSRSECLELLHVIISLKSKDPADCEGSEVCTAVHTRSPAGCHKIRDEMLNIIRNTPARSKAP